MAGRRSSTGTRRTSALLALALTLAAGAGEPACAGTLAPAVEAESPPAAADTAASPPAAAASPSPALSYPRLVLSDLRHELGAPLRWRAREWGWFSLAVSGVGVAALADRSVRDSEQRDHSRLADAVARDFEPLGSAGAFGVLGAFYLAGVVGHDDRGRAVGEDGLAASLIAAGILTPVLKDLAGRQRPHQTSKTFDFTPFGGGASFPSGHTTEAFAVASVIATDYHSGWISAVSYGSAALVGFARVHHQAHFLSDVTASAFIGTAVGRSVALFNRGQRGRSRRAFVVAPIAGPRRQPGIALALSF
ncbi:MAG TPA: phosphatase PAP2 family protein [Thermoanaerobaculia bacterium]